MSVYSCCRVWKNWLHTADYLCWIKHICHTQESNRLSSKAVLDAPGPEGSKAPHCYIRICRLVHNFHNLVKSHGKNPWGFCGSVTLDSSGLFEATIDLIVNEKSPCCVPKKLFTDQGGANICEFVTYLLIMMLNLFTFLLLSFGASSFSLPR